MDYDRTSIPLGYDKARDHGPEFIDLWMNALASLINPRRVDRIVDLGCGTGRFSDALAVHFASEVVAIDPSEKMLKQARGKKCRGRVRYLLASAEAIPVAEASADMVFMSMVFHHFSDRRLAARECRRVLRKGGVAMVRTGTRERVETYPYIPFFPSTMPKLLALLPDHGAVREPFELAGFSLVASQLVTQIIAPSWEVYADKLAAGGDSVLATLSTEELEAGVAAIRRRGAEGTVAISEPIDLLVFR